MSRLCYVIMLINIFSIMLHGLYGYGSRIWGGWLRTRGYEGWLTRVCGHARTCLQTYRWSNLTCPAVDALSPYILRHHPFLGSFISPLRVVMCTPSLTSANIRCIFHHRQVCMLVYLSLPFAVIIKGAYTDIHVSPLPTPFFCGVPLPTLATIQPLTRLSGLPCTRRWSSTELKCSNRSSCRPN